MYSVLLNNKTRQRSVMFNIFAHNTVVHTFDLVSSDFKQLIIGPETAEVIQKLFHQKYFKNRQLNIEGQSKSGHLVCWRLIDQGMCSW